MTLLETVQKLAQVDPKSLIFEFSADGLSLAKPTITGFHINGNNVTIRYFYTALVWPVWGEFQGTIGEHEIIGKMKEANEYNASLSSGEDSWGIFLSGQYYLGDKTTDGRNWKISLPKSLVG